jgi:hypothetical protein
LFLGLGEMRRGQGEAEGEEGGSEHEVIL